MIFSIMSWNMSIESKAADDDKYEIGTQTRTYTSVNSGTYPPSDKTVGGTDSFTLDAMKGYNFVVGHQYEITFIPFQKRVSAYPFTLLHSSGRFYTGSPALQVVSQKVIAPGGEEFAVDTEKTVTYDCQVIGDFVYWFDYRHLSQTYSNSSNKDFESIISFQVGLSSVVIKDLTPEPDPDPDIGGGSGSGSGSDNTDYGSSKDYITDAPTVVYNNSYWDGKSPISFPGASTVPVTTTQDYNGSRTLSLGSSFNPSLSYQLTCDYYVYYIKNSPSASQYSWTCNSASVQVGVNSSNYINIPVTPGTSSRGSIVIDFSPSGGSSVLNCNSSANYTVTMNTKNFVTSPTFSISLSNIKITEFRGPLTEGEHLANIDKSTQEQLKEDKEQTETQKGIWGSIKEFFGGFFQNLINSVISLFVPSSDEMSDLFGQLNDFFSEKFGFLYAPFDYLIQLIGVFTSSSGTTGLTFPGFSLMGHEVWAEQTYDIASDSVAGQVLEYVRIGTGVLLAGWFIMYLQDFFKERFGKG